MAEIPKPKQLTRDDLKKMTPEAIVKAEDDGQLRNLLNGLDPAGKPLGSRNRKSVS